VRTFHPPRAGGREILTTEPVGCRHVHEAAVDVMRTVYSAKYPRSNNFWAPESRKLLRKNATARIVGTG